MNQEEKDERLPSGETQKNTSVSSTANDCYVPESDKLASPHQVKQELLGGESLKEQRDVLFRQIKHDACDYESILDDGSDSFYSV